MASGAADKPDLVISTLSDPPATAHAGDSFALTSTVTNQGLGAAVNPSTTKFYLMDGTTRVKNLKGVQAIAPLGPGESDGATVTISVYSDTDTGLFTVQACADGSNDVLESLEDDNCLTSSAVVKVVGPPDLIVTRVIVKNAPLSVARGGTLTITADVKNQGEGDAPPSTVKFLLVNTVTGVPKNLNGTKDYSTIKAGTTNSQQRIVTVYLDTDVGTYVVQACADSLDVVAEASETNNCFTATGATTTVQ